MGMPRASAYSISSSRVQARSRSGAITSMPGRFARNASSKRSWSLPLPVQPWTAASAPELDRELGDGLRDHRPREGGDERVLAFVERVRLERLRDLLAGERLAAVDEGDVGGAGRIAALARLLEVELLADVAQNAHDLVEAVVLLEPRDDAGRIQPAAEGEYSCPAIGSCNSFEDVGTQLVPQGRRRDARDRDDEDRVVARDGARGRVDGGTRRSPPPAAPRSRAA